MGSPGVPGSLETGEDTPERRGKTDLCPPAAVRQRRRGLGSAARMEILGKDRRTEVERETQRDAPSRRCRLPLPRQTLETEFVSSIYFKYFSAK